MKKYFAAWNFPLRLLAFWLLYFAAFRLWFVLWFRDRWSAEAPLKAWASFWHALPLDGSMAAYLLAIPVLLWFIGLTGNDRVKPAQEKVISGFNILIFTGFVFLFGANLFLYEEWHTPLNNRALGYMATPAALLDSMSGIFIVVCIGLYVLWVWVWWRVYRFLVGTTLYGTQVSRWQLSWLPVQIMLLGLAIRGGTGVMPINESAVYYSAHLFDNHAATNTAWHFLHSLIETRSTENHFRSMPEPEARERLKQLFGWGITGNSDLPIADRSDSTRLNVVFIIMESMTAQVIEELGGEKGVCPNLSRLIREGILFENCYGSGYRTDQGLVSILAGYPAQPDQSVVLLTDKAEKLPSLPKTLRQEGYSTAFYYGGELTFANIGVWLRNQEFEHIVSEEDFQNAEKTQRWGVDDDILLQRFAREINQLSPPFFATGMTLSLHPPFDVPYHTKWEGSSDHDKFLNSAAFADYAIGAFFNRVEKQNWYPNTIFVLVADHGNSLPNDVGMDQPLSREVPFIIFGHPLNQQWKGRKIPAFCNHHDIPATVLGLLGQASNPMKWSRNLWHQNWSTPGASGQNSAGFAYYTNESGLGWINKDGDGFYFFENKEWSIRHGTLDSTGRSDAKAYLQELYEDFLSL